MKGFSVKRTLISAACLALSAAFAMPAFAQTSGLEVKNFDTTVRVQDDFFNYVNGTWMKKTEIPADKSRWGSFDELRETALANTRTLIESSVKAGPKASADTVKIANIYTSFLNEKGREAAGFKPLKADLTRINALKDKKDLPALFAYFHRTGISMPFSFGVNQDAKDVTKHAVYVSQSGLGMPDRDYYLLADDKKMADVKAAYAKHMEKMLALSGDKNAAAHTSAVLELETALAKVQWTRVENRDPTKTINKMELAKLAEIAPDFDWKAWAKGVEIGDKVDYLIVSQPSYFTAMTATLKATPLDTIKSYLSWRVIESYAQFLNKEAANERFAFTGTTLRGVKQEEPQWQLAVRTVDSTVGFAVGKMYVEKYFPPENKARMDTLVKNLLAAFKDGIDQLAWMGPETKKEAHAKLAGFTPYIGYPTKWRDYSALKTTKNDLVANIRASREFNYRRGINKLGKPVDRDEWSMMPQTVNASYSPLRNSITFPAAILQPPFFDAKADDAVNYGAIGAVIGHEIGHGFDDQGSQFDAVGNLRNWWTAADRAAFKARTDVLVAQYSAFEPVPGYKVNGAFTLGENIGDNSGLAVAFNAYKRSLGGKPSTTIDGYTGEQRFYLGFGQIWRGKSRDEATITQIKSDPHTPAAFRGPGAVVNQPGFYEVFNVKEGDKLYVAPEKRAIIW
jgi:putative endopeptidase